MDEPKESAELDRPRHVEVDVDRGVLVGVVIGVGMFIVVQAMILGAFQTGVIRGETALFAPLKYSGISQVIYVAPTVLLFVNRKCPEMAKGAAMVAAVVLVGSVVSLLV